MHARGSFEVRLDPHAPVEQAEETNIGRMAIDKRFSGDLEATSRGEMLTASTDTPGSAGYVAVERVNGGLHGRRGTFMLQHHGLLARGVAQLTITVVPDSGAGELAGLAGVMTINIDGEGHSYDFEYSLPGTP